MFFEELESYTAVDICWKTAKGRNTTTLLNWPEP